MIIALNLPEGSGITLQNLPSKINYYCLCLKGTVALGILVSITLLMGMLSNLILLPAFLVGMNKKLEQ